MIVLPLGPIFCWLLIFLRVGLILTLFPLFGDVFVPVRVRIIFSGMIALALTPVLPLDPATFPVSIAGLAALVVQEAVLAAGIGMIGRIMFAIVQFAGQIMGEQMGFGLVNAIDPTGSHQISVVAEMQYVLSILLFFATRLHEPLLRMIAWSFSVVPPGTAVLNGAAVASLMHLGEVMFTLALGLAMPVIAIIFAINVGLGMVARAVPQINVFMESFPLRIIAGLSVTMIILGAMAQQWMSIFADMERVMAQLVRVMGT